ncbi:uncharacterized protein LOC143695351 [Agelaius phoeniceus]|uniref:uncharacterized protein LOC143695351 n=1 Tax=Agelaius phoeniceus TaxID=39638 RepID=UPI0040551589
MTELTHAYGGTGAALRPLRPPAGLCGDCSPGAATRGQRPSPGSAGRARLRALPQQRRRPRTTAPGVPSGARPPRHCPAGLGWAGPGRAGPPGVAGSSAGGGAAGGGGGQEEDFFLPF